MSTGTVVTVSGPLPAAQLGATDAHEHLFLDTPAQPGEGFADVVRAEVEVEEAAATGLHAIVELTPIGLSRRPDLLRPLSESTGVAIIAATGYHRDAHYPAGDWVLEAGEDELAERVARELAEGMDGTHIRAGVIKGGASYERISAAEERRLRAIARASRASGAPMIVHTEAGTCGHAIVDLLLDAGATPDRITLAHMDRNMDVALHLRLVERGVNLVYDTIGRKKYATDEQRVDFIASMVRAGHTDNLMLGLDLGRRHYHRAWGGEPGLRYLMADFAPRLRERIDDAVDRMLIDNPRRVFAWGAPA